MATDQTQSPSGIADDTISITSANGTNIWDLTSSPYVFNGTNTLWTTTTTNTADWSIGTSTSQSGTLQLQGDNADIVVNGRSLMDAIDTLEQRLNILVPNPELEAEWDELRELGDRYRELERQCKEKGDMWAKLKSSDDDNR